MLKCVVLLALVLATLMPMPVDADAAPRGRRKPAVVQKDEEEALSAPKPEPQAPPSPALAHIVAGNKAFSEQQYDKAVTELRAAYALDPKPHLLFNIAQAQRRAMRHREAIASYREYLAKDPNGELRDKANTYIQAEETALVEDERRNRPFYKKAWFYGVLAGVAVGVGLGVGLGLGLQSSPPQTDKGIFVVSF